MKKLLLTYFEPFGADSINASAEIISSLPEHMGNFSVTKMLLPVVYPTAGDIMVSKALSGGFDAIIAFGQYAGAGEIRLENTAKNVIHMPNGDNAKNIIENGKICIDGPDTVCSTFNAGAIKEALRDSSIPVEISNDAGSYLCNSVLYRLLTCNTKAKCCGFIHLPILKSQLPFHKEGTPAFEKAQLRDAVIKILSKLA
ncbi:MAG: hypothetical protein E7315_03760 [Clostridiales bacterium]|nr:hypothetical protein [Clostridiales bacterium]